MYKTYDIIGKFKYVILIPILVVLTGIGFTFFRGVDLSIDYKGGSSITYSYEGKLNLKDVKKQAESALKSVGNVTEIKYNYTGTLDASTVDNAFSDLKFDGIKFSSEVTTENKKSVLNVDALGKSILTKDQIDKVTSLLNEKFSTNKVTFVSKTEDPYVETKVDVTDSTDYSTGTKSIKLNAVGNLSLSTAQLKQLKSTLQEKFPNNNLDQTGSNTVGKSFGSLFFAKSLYAVLIASILVVIYVGYRFRKVGGLKAAIAALVALVHDLLFIFFIDVIFGITVDTNFIAVFLTILGYSLNDTIVVYDRLRENSGLYGNKKSIRELMNMSISQSLKRTAVTSLTTFAAIMSVTVVALIKNLDSILTFSIPMSIGVVCGTFSSLFVAGPIYVFWCEHNEKKAPKEKKGKASKKPDYANKINPKGKKK